MNQAGFSSRPARRHSTMLTAAVFAVVSGAVWIAAHPHWFGSRATQTSSRSRNFGDPGRQLTHRVTQRRLLTRFSQTAHDTTRADLPSSRHDASASRDVFWHHPVVDQRSAASLKTSRRAPSESSTRQPTEWQQPRGELSRHADRLFREGDQTTPIYTLQSFPGETVSSQAIFRRTPPSSTTDAVVRVELQPPTTVTPSFPENINRLRTAQRPPSATETNPFNTENSQPLPVPAPLPAPDTPRHGNRQIFTLPFQTPANSAHLRIKSDGDLITLTVRNQPLENVLSLIAEQHQLNLVAGEEVKGNVTVALSRVPLEDALDAILKINGYTWTRENQILAVSKQANDSQVSAIRQGRQVRVFTLNYIAAEDAERIIKGLLSKAGQAFISQANPTDGRRTQETVVVEDFPDYLSRIESYLNQIDIAPRQVLIEAHVLQVDLSDSTQHGINLQGLARLTNSQVTFQTLGLANPAATPAMLLGLNATDLTSLVEALQSTNDVKTLASPKLMVVNGQLAKIQIGSRFGYFTTTTTQTTTVQNVDFLDVGVVFNVTPIIGNDGQVLLTVKPEISNGRINPTTGLPEEDTTEVETTVMLQDGQGMIVGGLIQENDEEVLNKVPYVGDIWVVGRAFRRSQILRRRREIVIALLPRIVPHPSLQECREAVQLEQATSPLMDKNLNEYDRRHWEGQLPDAIKNPRDLPLVPLPSALR